MKIQRLRRMCRTCNKMFVPMGKYQKICKECKEEAINRGREKFMLHQKLKKGVIKKGDYLKVKIKI